MTQLQEMSTYSFPLNSNVITIGRDSKSDIVIRALGVSVNHAEIVLHPCEPVIRDLKSSFGIRIDDAPVSEGVLRHNGKLTIGVAEFSVGIDGNALSLKKITGRIIPYEVPALPETSTITIGRDSSNVICLKHPLVSRFHCTVQKNAGGRFEVADHGSTNGTFINGRHVHGAALENGDIIQVGPFRFVLDEGTFVQADDARRIKLEAHDITVRREGRTLLDRVSLSIQPGEFVAILGPSGAGKSTLARALTGQIPVDGGTVYYNGFPLNRFAAAFSSAIGYVSQNNLLRDELTVWETFVEQVLLRLPRDSMEAERIARIKEVMGELGIEHLGNSRVGTLSGGEAKRVHLGVELLSSPTILFLDEPLAGLDPGLVRRFMELFRKLCEKGYTLILTTHTLEQIELCDRLIFISRGAIAYQGVPRDTVEALQVASLAEAYEKVRSGDGGDARVHGDTAEKDERIEKMRSLKPEKAPLRHPRSAGFFRQSSMLVARYEKVLFRDVTNLVLIILQAPLIALLLALVFHGGSRFLPLSFYFCVTISAIWIGGVNSVREIAREWELYEREFRAGLSPTAYVTAKCVVFSLLGFFQALLFTISLRLFFRAFGFDHTTILLITATVVSGTVLGLAVSAFSGNVNRAVSLLPIVFIPQIFFSGILIPFDRMPDLGRIISNATISRPAFSMFKKACILGLPSGDLTEWIPLVVLNALLLLMILARMRWHYFFARSRRN